MSLIADSKYNGTVGVSSRTIQTQGGTLGYQIPILCEDGDTSFTIWITDKNRKNALKSFASLGITEQQLADANFVEYGLALAIQGKEITFGTVSNTYKDKTTVQVGWIGKRTIAGEGGLSKSVAGFFGGAPATPITDDDIPF